MKYLLLFLLITGCSTVPVTETVKESPPVVTAGQDFWPSASMRQASINALRAYGKELLAFAPRDAAEWGMKGDRLAYYNRLFSAMSYYESTWRPNHTYKESFDEDMNPCKVTKKPCVISTGLIQVSEKSCRGYGVKGATTESLKNISQNLECAVRIFNKWVPQDGVIAQGNRGAARYFSTLRPTGKRAEVLKMVRK